MFSFVGDTQRPDECGDEEQEINQDNLEDVEDRSITRVDTQRRTCPRMGVTKEVKLLSG